MLRYFMIKPNSQKMMKVLQVIFLNVLVFPFLFSSNVLAAECTEAEINNSIKKFQGSEEQQTGAIKSVVKCGEEAVKLLSKTLESPIKDKTIALKSIEALQKIGGKSAVLSLIDVLKNNKQEKDIRLNAISALGDMEAKDAVPALTDIFRDKSQPSEIRAKAISRIGQINPDYNKDSVKTVNELIKVLKEESVMLSELAVNTISEIKSENLLQIIFENIQDDQIKLKVSKALGMRGWKIEKAVPILIKALKNGEEEDRNYAFKAIGDIAIALKANVKDIPDTNLNNCLASLKQIQKYINNEDKDFDTKNFSEQEIKQVKTELKNSIKVLEEEKIRFLFSFFSFLDLGLQYPIVSGLIIYICSLGIIYSLLFWCFPLKLLNINEFLKKYGDLKIPGLPDLPIKYLVLGGLFHYHPRVLNAWVASHIASAKEEFINNETVKKRKIYIPISFDLDGNRIEALSSQNLKYIFAKTQSRLLIYGEGGSGKTSLACQIGKWAMEEDQDQRLCHHKMLPILIEEDLKNEQDFISTIHGKLQDLSDELDIISTELLEQLLRKKRILVIVDHLSEMSQATQRKICPEQATFPVYALVVTSRSPQFLTQVNKTTIYPRKLSGAELVKFMEKYLQELGKENLLKDQQLLYACGDLSLLLSENSRSDRSITVLLAKLYAQVLVAFQEGEVANVPKNIPDLMLSYLNEINSNVTEDKRDNSSLHEDVKMLAWECLKVNYRPTPVKIKDIKTILGDEEGERKLQYLEKRLSLIKTLEPAQDKITFDLDTLAEYMAGLYLVENLGSNQDDWQDFLKKAEAIPDASENIKGFLLAVRDCCLVKQGEYKIPPFVVEKLTQLTALNSKPLS
jgi:hypothetical protein